MNEFLNLIPPNEALNLLLSNLDAASVPEVISTELALGRITAQSVLAPVEPTHIQSVTVA